MARSTDRTDRQPRTLATEPAPMHEVGQELRRLLLARPGTTIGYISFHGWPRPGPNRPLAEHANRSRLV
jgi:hypothetical protein